MDGGAEIRLTPGGGSLDKTLNNRITLRFRPIAPKPIAGPPVSDQRSTMLLSGKRSKRKYVRVRRNCRHHKDNTTNSCTEFHKPRDGSVAGDSGCKRLNLDPTAGNTEIHGDQVKGVVETRKKSSAMMDRTVRVVDTWVTVERVTGSCMMELGRTDDQKVRNLEQDTCPAFVSDGLNRLWWVNEAYRKMVVREEEGAEVMVWLKIEDVDVYSRTAFSCKVKLLYYHGNHNGSKCTKVVPCDAWKMDTGGFAWRLDVQAALGLGL